MPPKSKPGSQEEESQRTLLELIEEHKKPLVGVGLLVGVAVVALILYLVFESKTRDERWTEFLSASLFSPITAGDVLHDLDGKAGSDLEPHVLYNLALHHMRRQEFDKALDALNRLQTEYPDAYLNYMRSPDQRYSLPAMLKQWIEKEKTWEAEHTFEAPEPNTDQVALVETSQGAFWIGFYPELAPKHVESFLALAKSGALNGTSVTSVTPSVIYFGGEASKDEDPYNDADTGEETPLEPEPARFRVPQQRGAISTVPIEGGESPTRFALVAGANGARNLDKQQTVFGQVLTAPWPHLQTLDDIRTVETYLHSQDPEIQDDPKATEIPDHPVETIRILRVSVWKDGKLEDGHEWDTSAVVKPEKPAEEEPSEEKAAEGEGEGEKDDVKKDE